MLSALLAVILPQQFQQLDEIRPRATGFVMREPVDHRAVRRTAALLAFRPMSLTSPLISQDKAYPSRPSRSRACTVCCPNHGTLRRDRAIGPDRILAPLE